MSNPFDEIINRIEGLENLITDAKPVTVTPKTEIINRQELCKRLNITEPTAIRWEKKGAIPCFRIGSNVRYNWPSVVETLENKKTR